jgi:hypothetical protein
VILVIHHVSFFANGMKTLTYLSSKLTVEPSKAEHQFDPTQSLLCSVRTNGCGAGPSVYVLKTNEN